MESLYDVIDRSLDGDTRTSIGQELGVDSASLESLLPAATALVTGAMARQTGDTERAASLDSALERDHDGSILDLSGDDMVRAARAAPGDGILKHILGGARGDVEQALGQTDGARWRVGRQVVDHAGANRAWCARQCETTRRFDRR